MTESNPFHHCSVAAFSLVSYYNIQTKTKKMVKLLHFGDFLLLFLRRRGRDIGCCIDNSLHADHDNQHFKCSAVHQTVKLSNSIITIDQNTFTDLIEDVILFNKRVMHRNYVTRLRFRFC